MAEHLLQSEELTIAGASICLVSRNPFNPLRAGFDVLAIQRDDVPTIPYPGQWEFPGGTLDPGETAIECALRELWEETNIHVPEEMVIWEAFYPRAKRDETGNLIYTAFFGAEVNRFQLPKPVKGSEGKACAWLHAGTFTGIVPAPGTAEKLTTVLDHKQRYDDFIASSVSGTPHAIGRRLMQGVNAHPLDFKRGNASIRTPLDWQQSI